MTFLIHKNTNRPTVANRFAVANQPTATLEQTLNHIFNNNIFKPLGEFYQAEQRTHTPLALDVFETKDSLVMEAALPGFNPEDVDIAIQNDTVTFTVEAKSETNEAETKAETNKEEDGNEDIITYHLRERRHYNTLKRTLTLPFLVKAETAEATFKNGILTLVLPKVEEEKPKRVTIKTQ